MNKKLIWVVAFLSTSLLGCVQVTPVDESRSQQLAVSSVQDYPFEYKVGDRFNVVPRHAPQFEQFDVAKRRNLNTFYKLYEKAIIKELKSKGFVHSSSPRTDFSVGYGLALGKDFTDEQLSEKFGVVPGLNEIDDLEKGSFIIYIEDSAMEKRVWRGAVQGFVQDGYSEEEQNERVTMVVNMILRQALTQQ